MIKNLILTFDIIFCHGLYDISTYGINVEEAKISIIEKVSKVFGTEMSI